MTNFTPGPWIHTGAGFIKAANGETITNNEQYYPYLSDNDADFDLIAAAPEMYGALTKAESYLNHGEGQEPSGQLRLISAIELILAQPLPKAEGKQP